MFNKFQEQLDDKSKKINDLIKNNNILYNRLRDHGLNDYSFDGNKHK